MNRKAVVVCPLWGDGGNDSQKIREVEGRQVGIVTPGYKTSRLISTATGNLGYAYRILLYSCFHTFLDYDRLLRLPEDKNMVGNNSNP